MVDQLLNTNHMLKGNNTLMYLIIAALILIISIQFNCNRELASTNVKVDSTLVKVDVPKKTGTFKPKTKLKPVTDTIIKKEYIYVPVENKPNTALLKKYKKENDSLRLLSYSDAITSRSYLETFEDDKVKIDFVMDVTGYLDKVSVPSYTIKPSTVDIYEKTTTITKVKNRLAAEIEMGVPTELNTSVIFKAGLSLDTRKNLRYKLGVDTEKRVWGGVGIIIF